MSQFVCFTYSKLTEEEKESTSMPAKCPNCDSGACKIFNDGRSWLNGFGRVECATCGFKDDLTYTYHYESAPEGTEFLIKLRIHRTTTPENIDQSEWNEVAINAYKIEIDNYGEMIPTILVRDELFEGKELYVSEWEIELDSKSEKPYCFRWKWGEHP